MRARAAATALALLCVAAPARAEEGAAAAPCALTDWGCFLGPDGRVVREEAAYEEVTRRGEPHALRAVIELAAALGAGTAWYWIDRERQVADWDFPSIKQRVTFEAWRFDNNPFAINAFWHPVDGAGFHWLARANDFSLPSSAALTFSTSLAWELLLEFREKISVNDVIVTPGAGVAMGEFAHWLGRYVSSAPPEAGWAHEAARWVFGFPEALHDAWDGRELSEAAPDGLGFSSSIWHRFDLAYAVDFADLAVEGSEGSARLSRLRASGRLVALPGYRRPGRFGRAFGDANWTALWVDVGEGGTEFRADTVLLGLYRQDVPVEGLGSTSMAGVALAYDYRREDIGAWDERLSLMHLPGLAVDADLLGRGWRFTVSARAHVDFASIDALAHDRWVAEHPGAVEKTILRKQGYYYGWGGSVRAAAELALPHVALGGSVFYGHYDSVEGLDRNQEEIEADVDLEDAVLDAEAYLRAWPLSRESGPYLELAWSTQRRRGEHDGLVATQSLDRLSLGMGLSF